MKILKKFRTKVINFYIKRKNHKVAYDFTETLDGWVKGKYPVWGHKQGIVCFDPFVRIWEDLYLMMYSNRNTGNIEQIASRDGSLWGKQEIVISGSKADNWEHIVNRGCFLYRNGKKYVWYTGQNNGISSIGFAECIINGKFEKYNLNPIIRAEKEFEGVSVMNPCVLWDEESNFFKMWYAAGENYEPDVICYATSQDGINWKKRDAPVLCSGEDKYDQYKVGACDVVKLSDNQYVMYYIGYQNIDIARICKAYSEDGIHWVRSNNNPQISPSKGSWDSDAVYKPTVCISKKNDKIMMWYNARKGRKEYIGQAIKALTD